MIQQSPARHKRVGSASGARSVKPVSKPLILKDFIATADSIKP